MREMTLEQVRQTEIEILDFINDICSKTGLSYYIEGGTLLGAVRHKGFIPWDDDIDILVPRKDYRLLMEAIEGQNSKYKVLSAENDPNYRQFFFKVVDTTTLIENRIEDYGINVDVFPLETLPSNLLARRMMQTRAWYLQLIAGLDIAWVKGKKQKGPIYRALCFLCHMYGWRRAFYAFENMGLRMSQKNTAFLAELIDIPRIFLEYRASSFSGEKYLQFEGKLYPGVPNYDDYLTQLYGNYMQLPPPERRVLTHSFRAFFKD